MRYAQDTTTEKSKVIDKYNRTFAKLRISLTNQCNLSCKYCVSGDGGKNIVNGTDKGHVRQLEPVGIYKIVKSIHSICELKKIKLTGGEPLLYHGIFELIDRLNQLEINKISITTNGFFLKHKATELIKMGVNDINVSLDAADPLLFNTITKRDGFYKVLEGIETVVEKGATVKLNAVILKGVNENQIIPLLELANNLGIEIRFLELMKMGYLYQDSQNMFFSENEILSAVKKKYRIYGLPREKHATANYWKTENGLKFGIIANESSPFCKDCDRLRLDSYGRIYGCISEGKGIDMVNIHNEEKVLSKLKKALFQKQEDRFRGSPVSMLQIGG